MKKTIFTLLGLAALALTANAENKVTIEDVTVEPGGYVWAVVNSQEDAEGTIGSFQLFLSIPDGVTFSSWALPASGNRDRFPMDEETEEYGHVAASNVTTNDTDGTPEYRCMMTGMKGWVLLGTEGQIGRFKITADDAFVGSTTFKINYFKAADFATQPNSWTYATPEGEEITISSTVTAVQDVTAGKAVAGVKYVNLAGQVSSTPFDGVNMVVTSYADGSTVTTKVIK